MIGAQPVERQWQQLAMLEAIPAVKKDDFGTDKPIDVPAKPAAVDVLATSKHKTLANGSKKVAALFAHRSQLASDADDWLGEFVRHRAEEEGRRAGVDLAESFRRLRFGS